MKLFPNVLIPEPFPPGPFLGILVSPRMHLWDSLWFGNGLDPGELWSKLPRKAEPEQGEHEAVKKELLPQEETGKGGEEMGFS